MKVGEIIRFVGIDISTSTGLCILDEKGNVIESVKISAKNLDDPQRMMELATRVMGYLDPTTDKVLIEGYAYGAKGRGVSFQYGAGWIMREALVLNSLPYLDIAPTVVKKFATNNGQAKKEAMILPIFKKWGFEHDSDDVRDAYVLARIAYSMYFQENLREYEKEILKKIKKI